MSKKIEIGENLTGIIALIIILAFIFLMSSCNPNEKPVINHVDMPFVVSKVADCDSYEGHSMYYNNIHNGTLIGLKGCLILPTGFANVDDTINIERFYEYEKERRKGEK